MARLFRSKPPARRPGLRRTRKQRVGAANELVCERVYRPAAQLVVLALAPLGVPPPAVVLAGTATGLAAAFEIHRADFLAAALLLQVKTVLDNADGQLARATDRVTAFGRYLDSESDLLVDVALFAALGDVTGKPWLALASFAALTLVLSIDFNMEFLYREAHGERAAPLPPPSGAARVLSRVYDVVYAPQDRLVRWFVQMRLVRLRAGAEGRAAYHDRLMIAVLANFGLSTQLAVLSVCLVAARPDAYLWIPPICLLVAALLQLGRERRVRRARP